MLFAALFFLPLALAGNSYNPKCRFDQCAWQVKNEKSSSCSALFPPKTVTPAPTSRCTTITSIVNQTLTSTLVAPATSTTTFSITQTETVESTLYVSTTQVVPSTTILDFVYQTEVASITDVETYTAYQTVTSVETDSETITVTSTSITALGLKRNALPTPVSDAASTPVNPHFALMTPNAVVTGLIQRDPAAPVQCPDRCANTASFSSACACLGFKTTTVTAPRSTIMDTRVITKTAKQTQTVTSAPVVLVSTTTTLYTTATSYYTSVLTLTQGTPVTSLTTSVATITSLVDVTITQVNTATAVITTVQTATATQVVGVKCTDYKLQISSPGNQQGLYLTSDYQLRLADTSSSSGQIFHIDTANGNRIMDSQGLVGDVDHAYNPSPFWFDDENTVQKQVNAGTWDVIACWIDLSGSGPTYPFTCAGGSNNNLIVSTRAGGGSPVYLKDGVPSGYTEIKVVAIPAC